MNFYPVPKLIRDDLASVPEVMIGPHYSEGADGKCAREHLDLNVVSSFRISFITFQSNQYVMMSESFNDVM